MRFLGNKGQWPSTVAYRAEAQGATFWFENGSVLIDRYDAAELSARHANIAADPDRPVQHHAVRLRFLEADTTADLTAERPLTGRHNFFLGNDPQRWASNVQPYASVVMHNVAPGCDARFYEGRSGLKYDLVVRPGSDPSAIRFTYDGAASMVVRDGALVINTALGRLVERIPVAYQDINGLRRIVACSYVLKNKVVTLRTEQHDTAHPLIIDPELSFATYSGSVSNNFGYTATFDAAGFLYAGSTAFGAQYPVTIGAYQAQWHGGRTDIAITKYDTTGSFLVWSTYLGGSAAEMPHSLVVDDNDRLIVLGTTGSADFPITSGAYDASFGGGTAFTPSGLGLSYAQGCDMIVSRLSADGSALLGSTYLGGSGNDGLNSSPPLKFNYADEVRGEVLLDNAQDIWVVSCTQSLNMPLSVGAAQATFAGGSHDGYIAHFNSALTTLLHASYIGGSGADAAFSGEIGPGGQLYICGGTNSSDLATSTSAFNPDFNGGAADAFVARIAPDLTSIEALSYWGSAAYDQAYFVEIDGNTDVYLFGQTAAPTGALIVNAPYNVPAGGQFIAKLDNDLSDVLLASRIGRGDGTPDISPTAFLVDVCDKIYTSGWGSSAGGLGGSLTTAGLPITPDAYQPQTDGNDLYLAVFDIDMNALSYATFYGGNISPEHVDGGTSRFDRRGRVYQSVCAGCQGNSDFPTTPDAWSATNNSGGCNNGLLKFDFDAPLVVAAFVTSDTICGTADVAFTNLSSGAATYLWDFGDTGTSTAASPTHTYAAPGVYTVTLTAFHPLTCNQEDLVTRTVRIYPAGPSVETMNDTLVCGPITSFTLIANSGGTANSWIWSASASFTNPINPEPSDSTAVVVVATSGTYHVRASNASPCIATDSVRVTFSNASIALIGDSLICNRDTAMLELTGADAGSIIRWSPDDEVLSGQGTTVISVAPTDPTTYGVSVQSPSGCSWSGNVNVAVSTISGSAVSATVDAALVLPGTTVQLNATPIGGVTYAWAPASLVSNAHIADPTAVITATTTFIVTTSDGICTRSATVTVTVHELVCATPDVFVPNTFTPNGDGQNDVLLVRGRHIARMEFMVFDRWGEKVFESTDPLSGWDGTFGGRPVDPAVFVYHLTVDCADGQHFFTKGNVTVIR